MFKKFGAVWLLSLVFVGEVLAEELKTLKGLDLLEKSQVVTTRTEVLLSAPKRISNQVEIEKDLSVSGETVTFLYELSGNRQLASLYKAYRDELAAKGEVLFSCEKRGCGSSNYWANSVFNKHKLYGRDSNQYYLVARLEEKAATVWKAVYFVKNGLKKQLVYEVEITAKTDRSAGASNGESGEWLNGTLFGEGGLGQTQIQRLKAYVAANQSRDMQLILYSDPAIAPSDAMWLEAERKVLKQTEQLRTQLPELKLNVGYKLLGPFHTEEVPEKAGFWFRVYLY